MTERRHVLIGAGAMLGAAAMLAGGLGIGAALPVERAFSPQPIEMQSVDKIPPREKRNRKIRERTGRKARRAAEAHDARRRRKFTRPDAYARAVNEMTNWQRNQWARAGYPGSKKREAKVVRGFATGVQIQRFAREGAR